MGDVYEIATKRAEHDGTAATFRPLVAFDSDSEDFVLGYEMGLLFGRLDARPTTWSGTYHAANREMISRTANSLGYAAAIENSSDPAWVFASFEQRAKGGEHG